MEGKRGEGDRGKVMAGEGWRKGDGKERRRGGKRGGGGGGARTICNLYQTCNLTTGFFFCREQINDDNERDLMC